MNPAPPKRKRGRPESGRTIIGPKISKSTKQKLDALNTDRGWKASNAETLEWAIAIEGNSMTPRIDSGHWMELEFPFLQMQGRPVEIYLKDEGRTLYGMYSIDRHPDRDDKFSPVVIINNLRSGSPYSILQMRCRVWPGTYSLFQGRLPNGKCMYRIETTSSVLSGEKIPEQFLSTEEFDRP
jgi:hypothetical protein